MRSRSSCAPTAPSSANSRISCSDVSGSLSQAKPHSPILQTGTLRLWWTKHWLSWGSWELNPRLSDSSGTRWPCGPGSHRGGALAGVTVGQQFIHGDSKGPDIGRIVELTLLQTLRSIPAGSGQSSLGPDQDGVLIWGLGASWPLLGPHP